MEVKYAKYPCKFTHSEIINNIDVETFISGKWYDCVTEFIIISNGMVVNTSHTLKNELGVSVKLSPTIMVTTFETNPSLLRDYKIDEILN